MSDVPPPQHFVAYPRGNTPNRYGTADQLEALGNGFTRLNYVFIANIVLAIGVGALLGALHVRFPIIYLYELVILFLPIAALTYPQNKLIAFGKGWPPHVAVLASLLMGLNALLCWGLIGYVVMQNIASKEMKKYGALPGFMGVGRNFTAIVAARRQADAGGPTIGPTA